MNKINNGGPAFPVKSAAEWQGHGMTLRDYFAAKAMQSYLDHLSRMDGIPCQNYPEVASEAYEIADHMIAARGDV